jgi:hypothetical protein
MINKYETNIKSKCSDMLRIYKQFTRRIEEDKVNNSHLKPETMKALSQNKKIIIL